MMRRIFLTGTLLLLWGGTALAAQFDHAAHQTYLPGEECATCHVAEAATIQPDAEVCKGCHDADFIAKVTFPGLKSHGPTWSLQHAAPARSAGADCTSCHEQSDCLDCHKAGFADEQGAFSNGMNNVHRGDFHVSHPIAARTDQQLCASCHETAFCSDCHDQFDDVDLAIMSHRRGFSGITIGAGTPHGLFVASQCQNCHKDPNIAEYKPLLWTDQWHSAHAREARRNLATCQACHPEGDVCLTCHSARSGLKVNPHPDNWDDANSRLLNSSDGRSCRKCH